MTYSSIKKALDSVVEALDCGQLENIDERFRWRSYYLADRLIEADLVVEVESVSDERRFMLAESGKRIIKYRMRFGQYPSDKLWEQL